MATVKVTALQMPVTDSPKTNWKTIKRNILSHIGSDWIVTPECALSGYFAPPTLTRRDQRHEDDLEDCLEQLEDFQAKQKTGIVLGTGLLERDGFPYNTTRMYDRSGGIVSTYKKRLLTRGPDGGGEMHHYLPGFQSSYFYADVNNEVLASSLICNDVWASPVVSPDGNPYYINQLAQQGVQLIFVSANCNVPDHAYDELVYWYHEVTLRTLAKQNGVYIAVSNSSLSMPQYNTDTGQHVEPQPVNKVQLRSGIIAPNGEWIAWCDPKGEDAVTLELEF